MKGFAKIDVSNTSSMYTTSGVLFPYNCSGGTVEARKNAGGVYEVRFNGSGVQLAVATAAEFTGGFVYDAIRQADPNGAVFVVNIANGAGTPVDADFVIATP